MPGSAVGSKAAGPATGSKAGPAAGPAAGSKMGPAAGSKAGPAAGSKSAALKALSKAVSKAMSVGKKPASAGLSGAQKKSMQGMPMLPPPPGMGAPGMGGPGGPGGPGAPRPPRSGRIGVQEPWFTLISMGQKTVEVRLGDYFSGQEPAKEPKEGDVLTFKNLNLGFLREVNVKLDKVMRYASLKELIDAEGIDKVTPTLKNFADVEQMYAKFYRPERIAEKGLLAIRFTLQKK